MKCCLDCNKKVSKSSIRCSSCSNKFRKGKYKCDNSKKLSENNPNWKGNEAGKSPLHRWIAKRKPKPELCEICNERKSYDLANVKNHKYTRNPDDYKWLCRSCHTKLDLKLGFRKKKDELTGRYTK